MSVMHMIWPLCDDCGYVSGGCVHTQPEQEPEPCPMAPVACNQRHPGRFGPWCRCTEVAGHEGGVHRYTYDGDRGFVAITWSAR